MKKNYPVEVFHWAGMTDACLPDLKKILEQSPELIHSLTDDNENALIIASRVNNLKIVEYLIEETSINIHQISDSGNAFLVALQYNYVPIALYLAQKGLNINTKNKDGKTSYHMAALNGNDDMLEFLIQNNISANQLDYFGNNAIFDLISYYNSHKNYWCFELLKDNMTHDILFASNQNGFTLISYMEYLIGDSTNKIQKEARVEQFSPLISALKFII
jgi:ankyrin repeat protein